MARGAPHLLLQVNAARGATFVPRKGATLFVVQATTESDYGLPARWSQDNLVHSVRGRSCTIRCDVAGNNFGDARSCG